jgi:hypothetical protein
MNLIGVFCEFIWRFLSVYSSFAFVQFLGVAGVQEFRSSDDSAEGSLCVSLQGLEVLSELL